MTNLNRSNRTYYPPALDERATLTQFLQYERLTVHAKCLGLAQPNAAKTPLPSSTAMSITGLVSHLRWGEAYWVDVMFLGQPYQWPGTEQDSELQMRAGLERPLDELLDEYAVQAAHTDQVVAAHDLNEESARVDGDAGRRVALRFIVIRLIDETARHTGHLDILRELADRVTGD